MADLIILVLWFLTLIIAAKLENDVTSQGHCSGMANIKESFNLKSQFKNRERYTVLANRCSNPQIRTPFRAD